MTAWNKGFVSPGLCSGMSFLLWWRAWIWYCSYGKSKLWLQPTQHNKYSLAPEERLKHVEQ